MKNNNDRIKQLEEAIRLHDQPVPNWPSGKSTVDRNIRRHYMVQELETLKRLESRKDNNKC